jgi:hypothetical protein
MRPAPIEISRRQAIVTVGATVCLAAQGLSDQWQDPKLLFQYWALRSRDIVPRVLVACWSDGTVISCANFGNPGENLSLGRVDPEVLERRLNAIIDTGIFAAGAYAPSAVPDASTRHMLVYVAALKEHRLAGWDEVISPRWGENIDVSAKYEGFVPKWYSAKVNACALCPRVAEEFARVPPEEVRKYQLYSRAPSQAVISADPSLR